MTPRTDERAATELAGRGLRATRQRVALLRLLRKSRTHPTAAELHRALLDEQPNVSLKTVYEGQALAYDDPRMVALEAYILTRRAGKPLEAGKH